LTIDELLKVVENKVSKEEFQAFKIEVEKFFQNYQAMLFYLKPETGIPVEDLNLSLQNEINKIKNAYMIGNPIQPEDLPANVATKQYVDENVEGRIYPAKARDIIDEIVVARGDKTSIKEYIDLHALKTALIDLINSLSGIIDKARLEAHSHNEHPNRDATDCHPITAITDLTTELASKVAKTSVIADINASVEEEIISNIKVQPSEHNSTGGRDEEGCHPIEAITGLQTAFDDLDDILQTALDDLDGRIDTEEGKTAAWENLALTRAYDSFASMITCMYTALQNLLTSHPTDKPPCWHNYMG
jgi:hypothetical protein